MNPLLMSIVIVVALTVFGRTMVRKIQLLMALEPTDRANHLKERLMNMVILAIGQKRLVGRAKERSSGLMHAFIFWGFCVLLIRSITLYGEGFQAGFQLPFLGGDHLVGYLYIALKDIMEGIVLLMILWAIFRRAVLKPKRLHNTFEAYLVLAMIGILMVSDLLARRRTVQFDSFISTTREISTTSTIRNMVPNFSGPRYRWERPP